MKFTQSQRGFVVALLIGMLALPTIAIAVAPSDSVPGETAEAEADQLALAAPADLMVAGAPVVLALPASANFDPDLALACGVTGLDMVAREDAGELTVIESAALAALRPICAAYDLDLPDVQVTAKATTTRSAAASPATTVAASVASTTPTAPAAAVGSYDVDGGTVTLAFYENRVEVLSVRTNSGYKYETEREGSQEIEIKFEHENGRKSFVFVTQPGGQWKVVTANSNGEEDDD